MPFDKPNPSNPKFYARSARMRADQLRYELENLSACPKYQSRAIAINKVLADIQQRIDLILTDISVDEESEG